jgi:membrane protease YdiL (CAAX protease family)
MDLKKIVLLLACISLPLLIEKIKGKAVNDNFKLRDLSKLLTILVGYYITLFFFYVINPKDIDNFYFYTFMRFALAVLFIIGILRNTGVVYFKKNLREILEFPRFSWRSTFHTTMLFFFALTSVGAYLMVDFYPMRVQSHLGNFIVLKAINENPFLSIPVVILTEIFAITGEELVFRYFAINALKHQLKKNSAIIISSLIWTFAHWEGNFGIFFLGIFLGYLYYNTGSLSLCIVLHFLFNMGVLTETFYLFYKQMGFLILPVYYYAFVLFVFQLVFYHLAESVLTKRQT